jgi:hypothetical protein
VPRYLAKGIACGCLKAGLPLKGLPCSCNRCIESCACLYRAGEQSSWSGKGIHCDLFRSCQIIQKLHPAAADTDTRAALDCLWERRYEPCARKKTDVLPMCVDLPTLCCTCTQTSTCLVTQALYPRVHPTLPCCSLASTTPSTHTLAGPCTV